MTLVRRLSGWRVVALLAAVLCVVLAGTVLWQVSGALDGSAGSVPGGTATRSDIGLGSATAPGSPLPAASSADASTSATAPGDSASQAPGANASQTPNQTAAKTPPPTARPTRTDRPWQAGPALVLAKIDGRVTLDSQRRVVILDTLPQTPSYPAQAELDTRWTGLIQEPPRTGTDDKGKPYTDNNYPKFCGAGTAAVVLYYWPASQGAVTSKSGTFVEPVSLGANQYASTYWTAEGAGGNARGMIMYLAEVEWPVPDQGLSWWARPGLIRWENPPSTYVENLVDGINWEASGQSRLDYFYVKVPASQLTPGELQDYVHSDISMGVPVVIAARTSDGTNSLPFWNVRSSRSAVNHFVTVVGYDDTDGTYAVMDTCGTTCNDRSVRSGVGKIGQAALFALIRAESDDDGIMW